MAPTLSTHAKRHPEKQPQQPRKRSLATTATRKLNATKRDEEQEALEEDLADHFQGQEELIKTLAVKYGRTEQYMRTVVCNGAKYSGKRPPSIYHAIVHDQAKKAQEGACLILSPFLPSDSCLFLQLEKAATWSTSSLTLRRMGSTSVSGTASPKTRRKR